METFEVKPLKTRDIDVSVPASKSILNRALLLSAFLGGETLLRGVFCYGRDGKELIDCLTLLGAKIRQTERGLAVSGGELKRNAALNVGSGGTSARFLTAMLAFRGGEYSLSASAQMSRRPMEILDVLERAGIAIERENGQSFPFRMRSEGFAGNELTVNTDTSTQYASGLLLAAAAGNAPFTLHLTGKRTDGSYIATTLEVIRGFGGAFTRRENDIEIVPIEKKAAEYFVSPDVSGACYFYALSLLCGAKVLVRGVKRDCNQADIRFLEELAQRGVILTETDEGVLADGTGVKSFEGFELNLRDFSDQALTFAAMAPFARTPSVLKNIGHIRRQECDRVQAILENCKALGVPCVCRGENIFISPSAVRPAVIETFGDHRVAMAFSLVGLKAGGITISDPDCTAKTFENFFDILKYLT